MRSKGLHHDESIHFLSQFCVQRQGDPGGLRCNGGTAGKSPFDFRRPRSRCCEPRLCGASHRLLGGGPPRADGCPATWRAFLSTPIARPLSSRSGAASQALQPANTLQQHRVHALAPSWAFVAPIFGTVGQADMGRAEATARDGLYLRDPASLPARAQSRQRAGVTVHMPAGWIAGLHTRSRAHLCSRELALPLAGPRAHPPRLECQAIDCERLLRPRCRPYTIDQGQ